jgi:hypothetical protein
MIFTDPWVVRWLAPPTWFRYTMEALLAVGVIVVGKLWIRFMFRKSADGEPAPAREGSSEESLPARRPDEG